MDADWAWDARRRRRMSQVRRRAMRMPTTETVAATAARSALEGVEYVGGDDGSAVGSVGSVKAIANECQRGRKERARSRTERAHVLNVFCSRRRSHPFSVLVTHPSIGSPLLHLPCTTTTTTQCPGVTTSLPTGRSPSRSHTQTCSRPVQTHVSPSSATTSHGSLIKACLHPWPLASLTPSRPHPLAGLGRLQTSHGDLSPLHRYPITRCRRANRNASRPKRRIHP